MIKFTNFFKKEKQQKIPIFTFRISKKINNFPSTLYEIFIKQMNE